MLFLVSTSYKQLFHIFCDRNSQRPSAPSPNVDRENGAIATLNVCAPILSICFISKSPSYDKKECGGK